MEVIVVNFKKGSFLILRILFLISCALSFFLTSCSYEKIEHNWQQEHGYRWAELKFDNSSQPGFVKLSSSLTGITIKNIVPKTKIEENRILLNGSGVTAGDVDGDGYVDLYFTRLIGPNKLYKNLGGFRFKDITNQAGVSHEGYHSTGTVLADINGNGHLDLLITSLDGDNVLYLNDGKGIFKLKENSGLDSSNGSMTMALSDINGNGYPDLYITNYKKRTVKDMYRYEELTSQEMVFEDSLIPPFNDDFILLERDDKNFEPKEIGEKDELYFNNGDGTFTEVKNYENHFLDENGLSLGLYPDWGLTARFQDLDNNGSADLYVANDFWTPDRIWMNQGDGTFRALDTLAIRNGSYSSMAVDFSDIDGDGFNDIFVVEMLSEDHQVRLRQMKPEYPVQITAGEYQNRPLYNRNSMYLNRGDNTYAEISYFSNLEASEWSWATRFMDVTLDGFEDILVNTGFKLDFQNLDAQLNYSKQMIQARNEEDVSIFVFPELKQKNKAFKNNGNLTFSDVSDDWGFKDSDIAQGMALADFNNDGALDLAVSRMDDVGVIYKNNNLATRIAVRLVGKSPNTQAIGSKMELYGGPVEKQTKQIFAGGDYLSGSDHLVVFAAESNNTAHKLIIHWPDGTKSQLDSLKANRIYEIDQSAIEIINTNKYNNSLNDASGQIIFQDVSDRIGHKHYEEDYDDFRIQPLLPKKLSQLGPGVALFDLLGNGRDELFIGSGRGGFPGIYSFKDDESISLVELTSLSNKVNGDDAGIVGWSEKNRTHLVVGKANYEQGTEKVASAMHYQLEDGQIVKIDSLAGNLSTTGPLSAADYNKDGTVDLFVGGRFLPGQYPRDATSRLFYNDNGKLVPDQTNNSVFEDIGLVTGSVFLDINNDGEQDLIVSTEWGAVRLFINNSGVFNDQTNQYGLDQYKGLWQGITAGDFTGNGYQDLVVSNWGKNSAYQLPNSEYPLRIFFDDLNQDNQLDIFDSYFDFDVGGYVPRYNFMNYTSLHGSNLFDVRSHKEFSNYTIEDITHKKLKKVPSKPINTLQHTVFINNAGNSFTAIPLPGKAQLSPGFYVGVADMDNDGTEDIFISQNFFNVADPQTNMRLDSGRGLWLKGDGNGDFKTIPGQESGIKIYGEQRGAALGDFNQDGRVDLAVSQNAAETRLFINKTKQRGFKIKLSGLSQNTAGIGSSIRLVYEDGRKGPSRFIHAGSGYWSQNSFTQILGFDSNPKSIEVKWFDGTLQIVEIVEGQMDYVINHPDQ